MDMGAVLLLEICEVHEFALAQKRHLVRCHDLVAIGGKRTLRHHSQSVAIDRYC